jgi:hypothetical protein
MYEEQLWGAVLALLICLRFIYAGKVPNHDTAVTAGRCKQVAMHGAETDLSHLVLVMAERKELALHVSGIPDRD